MTPAEGLMLEPEKTTGFGAPKFARLTTLNASARNCKPYLSLMLILFISDVSAPARPGPMKDPRATFPKVPAAGSEKAFGLNHWLTFPRITGPLKAGFRFATSGV